MVSAGSYVLSVALLAALVVSLGFSAVRLRQRLLPDWEGAPAHLVEAIVGVALLIWLSELLGVVGLFYAGVLVGASVVLAVAVALVLRPGGRQGQAGRALGFSPRASRLSLRIRCEKQDAAPAQAPPPPPDELPHRQRTTITFTSTHAWGTSSALLEFRHRRQIRNQAALPSLAFTTSTRSPTSTAMSRPTSWSNGICAAR